MRISQVLVLFGLVSLVMFWPNSVLAGKKHCKVYREKLDNIQSQQRQGYSLKQGKSLKQREAKARDKWWQCEKGLLKTTRSKGKKSAKQAKKNKPDSPKIVVTAKAAKRPSPAKNKTAKAPFATTKAIALKQKYQGQQLQQWLAYYQPAKGCIRPKSMAKFAACIEDKNQQQLVFERKILKIKNWPASRK